MATATSQGRDPLFVSKSVRAAEIKIRFADIIVKSSSNKSEAMMKMRREKQKKQLQEEEARMKIRQEARLAVLKVEEEEARSDYLRDDKVFLIDHHVTSAQIFKGIRVNHSCIADMNIVNKTLGCVSVYKCESSATEPMILQMYKKEFGDASELTQVPAYLQRLSTAHPNILISQAIQLSDSN